MGATPPRVFHRSFWNCAYLFYIVWRCACGLGVIPLFFLSSFFSVFRLSFFFPGPISIRIDILCVQLLLSVSTDHLETMHICSTWSEDVHVVLGLSCHYLFSLFFQLIFFFSCYTMMSVACRQNSSFNFIPNLLKLCTCFCHGLKIRMCFWSYPSVILCPLFPLFRRFSGPISIRIDTLYTQLILQFSTYHF